ncbi:hypothetical protein GPJ56_000248 [Histomonas meleagridis]|uniref:uncharacterized protein n=1 Tax=Histomonas meleagridis TaxID=135588 RepID=UPI00355A8A1D|nr:hypothetical protein GPJ56_000248 [Histomonas meleagridis]KAH0799735.1 hypothetical protein GO595_007456 [Histomonas meleagridis]
MSESGSYQSDSSSYQEDDSTSTSDSSLFLTSSEQSDSTSKESSSSESSISSEQSDSTSGKKSKTNAQTKPVPKKPPTKKEDKISDLKPQGNTKAKPVASESSSDSERSDSSSNKKSKGANKAKFITKKPPPKSESKSPDAKSKGDAKKPVKKESSSDSDSTSDKKPKASAKAKPAAKKPPTKSGNKSPDKKSKSNAKKESSSDSDSTSDKKPKANVKAKPIDKESPAKKIPSAKPKAEAKAKTVKKESSSDSDSTSDKKPKANAKAKPAAKKPPPKSENKSPDTKSKGNAKKPIVKESSSDSDSTSNKKPKSNTKAKPAKSDAKSKKKPAKDSPKKSKRETSEDDVPKYVPEFLNYRCMRRVNSMPSGSKVTFEFSLDDNDLYHCKMRKKHQLKNVPISEGSETHISSIDNYLLSSSHHFHNFTLMSGSDVLLKIKFDNSKGGKKPKAIKAKWTPNDGTRAFMLVSKEPDYDAKTKTWSLDFGGRYAKPSIKNAILVDHKTHEVQAMFRRVDPWEMHVDAKEGIPPFGNNQISLGSNIVKKNKPTAIASPPLSAAKADTPTSRPTVQLSESYVVSYSAADFEESERTPQPYSSPLQTPLVIVNVSYPMSFSPPYYYWRMYPCAFPQNFMMQPLMYAQPTNVSK